MTCIKTGARVFFPEYGVVLPADLYAIGNCILIRTNPGAITKSNGTYNAMDATHIVAAGYGDSFYRDDIGIFVVPQGRVEEVSQPVTTPAGTNPTS
jgi:hypothetical protein